MRLTAVVLTLDAERELPPCLAGLGFADEILVIDSGSRDRTCEIAADRGARVLQRPLERFDDQRNWAQAQATHPWVVFVDSDEEVSAELAQEIGRCLERSAAAGHAAYAIPRRNYFLGKRMRHCGWGRDRVVRLLRRDAARWEGSVHEKPRIEGTVGKLAEPLEHHPDHPPASLPFGRAWSTPLAPCPIATSYFCGLECWP